MDRFPPGPGVGARGDQGVSTAPDREFVDGEL